MSNQRILMQEKLLLILEIQQWLDGNISPVMLSKINVFFSIGNEWIKISFIKLNHQTNEFFPESSSLQIKHNLACINESKYL